MSDYKDYGSNKSSLVLEGAYKGIVAKIEDARERICKELETSNQQDLSAYESMMEGIRQGVESLLSEFRFVSQQNSAIYEFQEETRKNAQSEMTNLVNTKFDSIVTTLGSVAKKKEDNTDKRNDELSGEIGDRFDALLQELKSQHDALLQDLKAQHDALSESVNTRVDGVLEEISSRLNDSVGSVVVSVGNRVDGVVDSVEERLNSRFEAFAEEYNERLYSAKDEIIRVVRDSFADMPAPVSQQETDYEYLAERVASHVNSAIVAPQEIDYEYLADRVAARMANAIPTPQEIDYEYLADRIAARMAPVDSTQPQPVQPIVQTVRQEIDYDVLASKLSEKIKLPAPKEERGSTPIVMFDAQPQPVPYESERGGFSEESFDYDVLAEKIASILPETDYDLIAEKVAAIIPEVDYDAIYEHVASAVPQTDYDAMADKVASCIPLTDYDLIAERVADQIGMGGRNVEEDAAAEERKAAETEVLIEAITGNITDALSKQFDISIDEDGMQKLAEAVGQAFDYDTFAQKVADLIRGDETELFRIAQETTADSPVETKAVKYTQPLIEEEVEDGYTTEESSSEPVVIDYNAIAERVFGLLKEEEEERERVAEIARQEAERLRREEERAKKDEERARAREEERLRLEEELAKEAERARLAEERAQEAERIREEELARKEEEKARLEEEKARQEEERARLQEELAEIAERVRLAEERAQEVERIREEELARKEEEKARLEEEKALKEEELARKDEEKARLEEEKARKEEELARKEEELARHEEEKARLAEEFARKEEERLRKEEERARKEEEERIRQEQERLRQEQERIRQEQERLRQEEEERLRKEEEERLRKEEERRLAEMVPAEPELTEVEESDDKDDELAAAIASRGDDDEDDLVLDSDDPTKTVRYKRSFLAKIIQSDEDTKKYYGDLKNTLLSYAKVHSQISWSNDRITKGRETVAKIGIRGKTLCVYLALDPDEFPLTVYHQDYAGDTKMYEKTPLLMQIKSHVALKRTLKLIEIMMTKEGIEKLESFRPVDYTEMYSYRSDEALLDEGLIKISMMKKVDFNF